MQRNKRERTNYSTLQPARAAAFALSPPQPWKITHWAEVTVAQLARVSPCKNGLMKVARKALPKDAKAPDLAARLCTALGLSDAGDPRMWSCYWCQALSLIHI